MTACMSTGVAGVYPGWWDRGGPGGVLYRVPTRTLLGPIFSHILSLRAYPRPNEGKSEINDEVSEIESRIDLNIDQN